MMDPNPLSVALLIAGASMGGEVDTEDKAEWIASIGEYATVSFTEFPDDTFVTQQYEPLGVVFIDGDDNVVCCSENTYPEDGAGLDGNSSITLEFSTPITALAADFPGGLQCELYCGGQLVFISSEYGFSGAGNFGGLHIAEPFDTAVLSDWTNDGPLSQVFLDNLHFGPPIFEPADVNTDRSVDVLDVIEVILAWGQCPDSGLCLADITGDGTVGVGDLIEVLLNWSA